MPAFVITGAILNSALYLASIVVSALVLGLPWTLDLGVAGFGVTYLSYLAQADSGFLAGDVNAITGGRVLWGISLVVGFFAGMALLFRI
jgi:hypothetical protein